MKPIILLLCLVAGSAQAVNIFDPGTAALIVGTPKSGHIEITDVILRSHEELESALTFFDAFPAGTLDSSAGIIVILGPWHVAQAEKLNAMNLTVGNLGILSKWGSASYAGVIGISAPDKLAFGGTPFINSVGITGAPVHFYVQNFQRTGINANDAFMSPNGLANSYRLGFSTEPTQAFEAPETGNTFFLFAVGLGILCLTSKFFMPDSRIRRL